MSYLPRLTGPELANNVMLLAGRTLKKLAVLLRTAGNLPLLSLITVGKYKLHFRAFFSQSHSEHP